MFGIIIIYCNPISPTVVASKFALPSQLFLLYLAAPFFKQPLGCFCLAYYLALTLAITLLCYTASFYIPLSLWKLCSEFPSLFYSNFSQNVFIMLNFMLILLSLFPIYIQCKLPIKVSYLKYVS